MTVSFEVESGDEKVASVPQTCLLASKLAASPIGLKKLTKEFFISPVLGFKLEARLARFRHPQ